MAERLDDARNWGAVHVALPPELLDYAPELQRFWDAMVYKLRRNAHKGKWETVPMDVATSRLDDEANELSQALENGSTSEILMEAADVANMALIIANIGLEVRDAQQGRDAGMAPTTSRSGESIGGGGPLSAGRGEALIENEELHSLGGLSSRYPVQGGQRPPDIENSGSASPTD